MVIILSKEQSNIKKLKKHNYLEKRKATFWTDHSWLYQENIKLTFSKGNEENEFIELHETWTTLCANTNVILDKKYWLLHGLQRNTLLTLGQPLVSKFAQSSNQISLK